MKTSLWTQTHRLMFLVMFSLLIPILYAQVRDNTLTEKQKQDGWQLLFNGKDFAGWHQYGNKKIGSAWQIENDCIFLNASEKKDWQASNGGDIVTEKAFKNFHLQVEWKIAPNGNSGIIFLIQEKPKKYDYTWKTGLEMQILDNKGHSDASIPKHRAGDLYDLIASSSEPVHEAGVWNSAEIIVKNDTLDYYLNGVHIVHTILWNKAWYDLVAGSKFKEFPQWGTFKKGKIALQDHGDKVWYKNIRIKEL